MMKRVVYLTRTGPAFRHNGRGRTPRDPNVSSTPQFRIRGIDPNVWREFLARLERDNVRPGEFFYRAVHRYAAGDKVLELPPQSEAPHNRSPK